MACRHMAALLSYGLTGPWTSQST